MTDKWKIIPEFEQYMVSDSGKILNNNFHRQNIQKQIKINMKSNGYLRVTLSKEGKTKCFYVHRLVAEAFIPNPENKKCVNHKNGKRADNRVKNLEWVTYSENTKHMYDILNYKISKQTIEKRTSSRKNYKMSDETKRKIGEKNKNNSCKKVVCIELNKEFSSAALASEWLGLTKKVVCRACRNNKTSGGYHWKYLGE